MSKIHASNVSLKDLFKEVRALRRDVSVIMPMESLEEYTNKKEILVAYRAATRHIARTKRS